MLKRRNTGGGGGAALVKPVHKTDSKTAMDGDIDDQVAQLITDFNKHKSETNDKLK